MTHTSGPSLTTSLAMSAPTQLWLYVDPGGVMNDPSAFDYVDPSAASTQSLTRVVVVVVVVVVVLYMYDRLVLLSLAEQKRLPLAYKKFKHNYQTVQRDQWQSHIAPHHEEESCCLVFGPALIERRLI